MAELWDVYNRDRIKTGRVMDREEKIAPGDFHLVVHVCVFNSKGEMLIQKRQPFKKDFSGMWDVTVGGSAIAGETSSQAAERELFEELGIRAELSEVQPHLSVNTKKVFDDFYLIEMGVDEKSLALQYEEVECVKWANAAEITDMIARGEFIPYYKELIGLLFAMRGRYSRHQR